jgi:micrococcal nuclease
MRRETVRAAFRAAAAAALAALAVLLLSVGLPPAAAAQAAETAQAAEGSRPGSTVSTEVYITETGDKYHRGGCHMLSESKIPIPLAEAVRRGYGPCGICDPPVLEEEEAERARKEAEGRKLYRVNAAGLQRWQDADRSRMLAARVVEHVDGDTVKLRIIDPPPEIKPLETVRLLGVDTPETVHPEKPVEEFGKEASEFTRRRLLGREVLLAFDWDLRGGYGRLLAYIYYPGGGCHNAELIRQGYAHAYTRFPFQFSDQFRRLEREARRAGRGLWGSE